jgi:hypothetical protein
MKLLKLILGLAVCSGAIASVVQTTGAGSSVTTVNGSADFENVNALFDNPYEEGGMLFSRTGLSFNNNGCGFAGCVGSFPGFTGNYMYGTGQAGFFDLAAGPGNTFSGLEFLVGTGFGTSTTPVVWEAFKSSVLVDSGSIGSVAVGSVIGFNDPAGFDVLRYSDTFSGFAAPAFDTVRAQFVTTEVLPEPATFLFLAGGLAGLTLFRRRARR